MPTVVVGPGRLEVAHTPDEHVELRQVELAAELYAQMFVNAGTGGLPPL
jgi:acetylornithine deacetylase/succinyl-diaminopimelate desuccinylase-like protein